MTTFHTVLEKPTPEQYETLREVARLSNRVVVITFDLLSRNKGIEYLL